MSTGREKTERKMNATKQMQTEGLPQSIQSRSGIIAAKEGMVEQESDKPFALSICMSQISNTSAEKIITAQRKNQLNIKVDTVHTEQRKKKTDDNGSELEYGERVEIKPIQAMKKLTNLIKLPKSPKQGKNKIFANNPKDFVRTKPIWSPIMRHWWWYIYDQKTRFVIATQKSLHPGGFLDKTVGIGPSMNLYPKESWNLDTLEVVPMEKGEGFGDWTTLALNHLIEGRMDIPIEEAKEETDVLGGFIEKSNLANFQKEYVKERQANPEGTKQEWMNKAASQISFGKARFKIGYTEISVSSWMFGDVELDGKTFHDIPKSPVIVRATKPKKKMNEGEPKKGVDDE